MSLADQHNHFLDLADLADGQLRQLLDAAAAESRPHRIAERHGG